MNVRRLTKTSMTLTLVALLCLLLASPVFGQISMRSVSAKYPDVPHGAQSFNFTNITPNRYMHSYTHGTPHLLRFQNMWMLMNCSRNMELNITADPNLAMCCLSLNLRLNQSLRLRLHADADLPANIQTRARNSIGVYLTIEPNATATINSTLGLFIDEETIEAELGKKIKLELLSWAFWNGEEWETVSSQIDSEGYLVANTNHFSTWTVLDLFKPTPWTLYGGITAVVAVALIALVFVLRRRT